MMQGEQNGQLHIGVMFDFIEVKVILVITLALLNPASPEALWTLEEGRTEFDPSVLVELVFCSSGFLFYFNAASFPDMGYPYPGCPYLDKPYPARPRMDVLCPGDGVSRR